MPDPGSDISPQLPAVAFSVFDGDDSRVIVISSCRAFRTASVRYENKVVGSQVDAFVGAVSLEQDAFRGLFPVCNLKLHIFDETSVFELNAVGFQVEHQRQDQGSRIRCIL